MSTHGLLFQWASTFKEIKFSAKQQSLIHPKEVKPEALDESKTFFGYHMGWVVGILHHIFYFSCFMVVSFIGEENQK
jgi:hypothetical protein